jgi:hypothetical protein
MDKLNYLIESSRLLEKLVKDKTNGRLINTNVFLINSIVRTNRILISVKELIKSKSNHKYALYIVLRPLVLDYMYFHFLLYSELIDKDRIYGKEFLSKISYDISLDGVKDYRDKVATQLSILDEKTKKEIVSNFKTIFSYAIKSDHPDFKQVLFHSMEKDTLEIKASAIIKKFKNKDSNIFKLYDIYSFLSKYDHITLVSLFDIMYNNNEDILNETINLIHKNFINLLFLVDIENEIDEVKDMIKDLLKTSHTD